MVNASSGAVTYPGTFNNGAGDTAAISGRTAGAVTLSGPINDSNDTGGGITISGNSGGSTTFSNGTQTLNTGTGNAVVITNPDLSTHTVNFTGGALNIDTTSGEGLEATGNSSTGPDGTLNVTGTGNTIDTTTGRALGVTDSNVGATLRLRSKASHRTAPAPRASGSATPAATRSLTVAGGGSVVQGGNDTGGDIQQSTNAGIYLANTKAPSFNNVKIDTSGHGGVTGSTGVHDFSFTNGKILSSGHKAGVTPATNRDAAFDFADPSRRGHSGNNVDGAITINNNTLTNNWGGTVLIKNSGGTISNAVITNNATSNTPSDGQSRSYGVQMSLLGNATSVANLTKADISNNTITHPRNGIIQITGGNSTSGPAGTYGDPDSSTGSSASSRSTATSRWAWAAIRQPTTRTSRHDQRQRHRLSRSATRLRPCRDHEQRHGLRTRSRTWWAVESASARRARRAIPRSSRTTCSS